MSKFNGTNKSIPTGTNLAGGVSYDRPIKKEITSIILSSLLRGDSYYQSEKTRLENIENLVNQMTDDETKFLAKAMIFTRNEGKLRSISHFIACLLSEKVKGSDFLKSALIKTFIRPDDLTEVTALFNSRNPKKMIPNVLRRAFKTTLETKFDEYQFRKYAMSNSAVKLKDIIKLSHPNPKNFEDKSIFKRAIEDNLKNIDTAQTINASKTGEERVSAYVEQIKAGKMGYMACLKNVRTLMENGISKEDLKIWCNFITNQKQIEKSMVLPFRFVDAWVAVKDLKDEIVPTVVKNDSIKSQFDKLLNTITDEPAQPVKMVTRIGMVKRALESAFAISVGNTNIVENGEKIAILLDESSSMGSSEKSPFYIGKVLSTAIKMNMSSEDCLFYTWANSCTERKIEGSPFNFIDNLRSHGGGTDVAAPMKRLIDDEVYVDSIVILTDMQMYNNGWGDNLGDQLKNYVNKYRSKVNPNVKILFWNLQGYSSGAPIDIERTPGIAEISGYSDEMLKIIPKMWKDKDFLIKEIDSIQL